MPPHDCNTSIWTIVQQHSSRWLVCSLLLCCAIIGSMQANPAQAAALAELIVRPISREVFPSGLAFSFALDMKGMVPVRDELRDGAIMLVQGSLTLERERFIRSNEEIAQLPLEWLIRHDPLTREFTITDTTHTTTRGQHLDLVVREAWAKRRLVLVPDTMLEAGEGYRLRLELVLRYAQVPPWLERALFFWSWELSPQLVYEESFSYDPPTSP